MSEPNLRIDAEAVKLIGKTIKAVKVDSSSDRSYELRLRFTDGTEAKIDYFAQYADDAGLVLDWSPTETSGPDA